MSERKAAVVTGASGGIGQATARRLAAGGFRVLAHYRENRQAAEALCAGLPGADHLPLQADLLETGAAQALVEAALGATGRLDLLVNNAGIFEEHPLTTSDYASWRDSWRRTLAINLTGPADLCYWAARQMIAQGGGRIVNVSSRGAFRGEPDAPAYGASKAGLAALSQSLARALAPHGVLVYAVAPGFVETEMVRGMLRGEQGERIRGQSPLGRVARPEEVAETIGFLAEGDTEYLTGCIIDINGASYLRS